MINIINKKNKHQNKISKKNFYCKRKIKSFIITNWLIHFYFSVVSIKLNTYINFLSLNLMKNLGCCCARKKRHQLQNSVSFTNNIYRVASLEHTSTRIDNKNRVFTNKFEEKWKQTGEVISNNLYGYQHYDRNLRYLRNINSTLQNFCR